MQQYVCCNYTRGVRRQEIRYVPQHQLKYTSVRKDYLKTNVFAQPTYFNNIDTQLYLVNNNL